MKRKIVFAAVFVYFTILSVINVQDIKTNTKENSFLSTILRTAIADGSENGGGSEMGCYTSTVLDCPTTPLIGGGQRIVCTFTGVYGAPLYCTTTYCGNSNADEQRHCVRG